MLEILVRTLVSYLLWLIMCEVFSFDEELADKRWHIGLIVFYFIVFVVVDSL